MKRISSIAAIVIFGVPVASQGADLRAGAVRYDGGTAVYQMQPSQNVICDNCPSTPDLATAPPPKAIRFTPPPPPVFEVQEEAPPVVTVEKAPRVVRIDVYFNFNSARLVPTEKLRIRKTVSAEAGTPFVVEVDAYTCRIGTKRYNKALSVRRAKAVAAYLKSLGVTVTSTKGLGKHHFGGPLSKDRRAVIVVKERNHL